MPSAFKEWEVVCNALASGRQTILLRKGGIHEGREGFSFAHKSFYLFPTKYHAQSNHVREGKFPQGPEWQIGHNVPITHHAEVLFAASLTDWSQLEAVFAYHIFTEQTLKDRFTWEGKGMAASSIQLAFVRVSRLALPLEIIYEKRFGGCRSWVDMPGFPEISEIACSPVLEPDSLALLAAGIEGVTKPIVRF